MELEEEPILKFWQWFVKNEITIKECIENQHSPQREYVVDTLNELILSIGILTWDVGLNDDNQWFFTLSPNGNKEMLQVSQKIIADAPEHMDWLFNASKPAKNWKREFTIYDEYMDVQFIDASQWHYLLFEEEKGKIELVIEAKNISHLDDEIAETAAEQFVIHEIGELTRILSISSLVIVPQLEIEDESSKISVSKLKAHLAEIS